MTESRTSNSTFAIGGVSCSADSFEVAESVLLRIKFRVSGQESSPQSLTAATLNRYAVIEEKQHFSS